jgi:hypothetical protein
MKKKPNSKIIYSLEPYMVTPTEYIQIIAACIYGAALFFTIFTFQRSKRLDQISLATDVMKELRNLDRELTKISSESQDNDAKGEVYSHMLNTVDWLSFLVNEKMVTDKRLLRTFSSLPSFRQAAICHRCRRKQLHQLNKRKGV